MTVTRVECIDTLSKKVLSLEKFLEVETNRANELHKSLINSQDRLVVVIGLLKESKYKIETLLYLVKYHRSAGQI